MPNVTILGSAAGLPLLDRACAGAALDVGGPVYLFDVGAGVATRWIDPPLRRHYQLPPATGSDHGLDPYAIRDVFISHAHVDHIGDLPELISVLRLFAKRDATFRFANDNAFRVHMPGAATGPLRDWLKATGVGTKHLPFAVYFRPLRLGSVLEDEHIHVTALPSHHTGPNADAFSFRVRVGGRTMVYTGDVTLADVEDLGPGIDLLVTEGAHFKLDALLDVLRRLLPRKVVVTHLHPTLFGSVDAAQEALRDAVGDDAWIATDGFRVEL